MNCTSLFHIGWGSKPPQTNAITLVRMSRMKPESVQRIRTREWHYKILKHTFISFARFVITLRSGAQTAWDLNRKGRDRVPLEQSIHNAEGESSILHSVTFRCNITEVRCTQSRQHRFSPFAQSPLHENTNFKHTMWFKKCIAN